MINRRGILAISVALAAVLCWLPSSTSAQSASPGTGQSESASFKEVPFNALSSTYITPLGTAALSIRPGEWKHAETRNFVYHYFHGYIASPVAFEAEFYYRVIAKDLGKDTSHWERKAHIFVFESPEDWKTFQDKAKLDPWTGGIHQQGELFIQRDPSYKFKGSTLGHETSHLVFDRFFGSNVPLWLNEGYAEYISRVAYASWNRLRGYDARPHTDALAPTAFIPLDQLSNALTYPTEVNDVRAFYTESEKLVRFLEAADKSKFLLLLEKLSKGSLFSNALSASYGSQFPTVKMLEDTFRPYAVQPSNVAITGNPPANQ